MIRQQAVLRAQVAALVHRHLAAVLLVAALALLVAPQVLPARQAAVLQVLRAVPPVPPAVLPAVLPAVPPVLLAAVHLAPPVPPVVPPVLLAAAHLAPPVPPAVPPVLLAHPAAARLVPQAPPAVPLVLLVPPAAAHLVPQAPLAVAPQVRQAVHQVLLAVAPQVRQAAAQVHQVRAAARPRIGKISKVILLYFCLTRHIEMDHPNYYAISTCHSMDQVMSICGFHTHPSMD